MTQVLLNLTDSTILLLGLPFLKGAGIMNISGSGYTPGLASWHLPPNTARTAYATEGALYTIVHLSTDAVSAKRKA